MLIISYDIRDNKLRTRFAKMLIKAGAIVFIIGCLFQLISIFQSGENIEYFKGCC